MSKFIGVYPPDWPTIAALVKAEVGDKCERCGHTNDQPSGHVLTVHHLDGNKVNVAKWNLAALCQRCHLKIQGRIFLPQCYMFEHTTWFMPHVKGYYLAQGFDLQFMDGQYVLLKLSRKERKAVQDAEV